jgi:predicted site-specific integrase-resolvase
MQQKVRHLTQGELAERWNCSEASLERWRCEGIGPVFMKLNGRVLYRIEDIETYEAQCMRSSTSQPLAVGGAA